MKIILEVYIDRLQRYVNRRIKVSDNMKVSDLCEYIIVSLNGDCKHLYQLVKNDETTYLGPENKIMTPDEEYMDDLTIDDISFEIGDYFLLNYDFKTDWDIYIDVVDIIEDYDELDFNIVDGQGVGIIENIQINKLLYLYYDSHLSEDKRKSLMENEKIRKYSEQQFNLEIYNQKVKEYKEKYKYINEHKHYIMNITLDGLEQKIKREILVDSNVSLSKFCDCLIYSMNGTGTYYRIMINDKYLSDEEIKQNDLNYLELKEKQTFKIIYNNWIFNVKVKKVNKNYGPKHFSLLSGKGKGIMDTCSGVEELKEIIKNKDEKYDINDFNITNINLMFDMYY